MNGLIRFLLILFIVIFSPACGGPSELGELANPSKEDPAEETEPAPNSTEPTPPALEEVGEGLNFDIDTFRDNGRADWRTKKAYHEHRYDEDTGKKEIDFVRDDRTEFLLAIENCHSLSFRVENAHRASGRLMIEASGVVHELSGEPDFASANGGAIDFAWLQDIDSNVTEFLMTQNNLLRLVPAEPKDVQQDADDRVGSFTIKMACDAVENYEFTTYEHTHPRGGPSPEPEPSPTPPIGED